MANKHIQTCGGCCGVGGFFSHSLVGANVGFEAAPAWYKGSGLLFETERVLMGAYPFRGFDAKHFLIFGMFQVSPDGVDLGDDTGLTVRGDPVLIGDIYAWNIGNDTHTAPAEASMQKIFSAADLLSLFQPLEMTFPETISEFLQPSYQQDLTEQVAPGELFPVTYSPSLRSVILRWEYTHSTVNDPAGSPYRKLTVFLAVNVDTGQAEFLNAPQAPGGFRTGGTTLGELLAGPVLQVEILGTGCNRHGLMFDTFEVTVEQESRPQIDPSWPWLDYDIYSSTGRSIFSPAGGEQLKRWEILPGGQFVTHDDYSFLVGDADRVQVVEGGLFPGPGQAPQPLTFETSGGASLTVKDSYGDPTTIGDSGALSPVDVGSWWYDDTLKRPVYVGYTAPNPQVEYWFGAIAENQDTASPVVATKRTAIPNAPGGKYLAEGGGMFPLPAGLP